MTRFTDEEKRKCAEREVRLRRQVYRNRIETKRMSRSQANYQLAVMREIAEDYRRKTELPLAS